jgi:hypothetical protein
MDEERNRREAEDREARAEMFTLGESVLDDVVLFKRCLNPGTGSQFGTDMKWRADWLIRLEGFENLVDIYWREHVVD